MSTKIIGFQSKDQLGILKAFNLAFDPDTDRVIKIKGESGAGKSTAMDALKATIHGQKILQDKTLRGILNVETQILDGEHKLFIGFRPDGAGSFESFLYEKDAKTGKKKNNPTIEGVKCTPSNWQKLMTNELTWNYEGFTSKNPSEHKNTLLKLFQSHLKKIGVVFDTKSTEYKDSILYNIDKAIEARTYADMKRKEVGGVAGDLKDKYGIDVNRPVTFPTRIDLLKFENRIAEINKSLGNLEADKKNRLQEIRLKGSELEKQAMLFNDKVQVHNDSVLSNERKYKEINDLATKLEELCEGYVRCSIRFDIFPVIEKRKLPISFVQGKISGYEGDEKEGIEIIEKRKQLIAEYQRIDSEPISDDEYKKELEKIASDKISAQENNKICDAVDLYKEWQEKDGEVSRLQNEYTKLLTSIDIGVEGMKIFPDGDTIFLKYNGCHDPEYFHNPKLEYRKLNEYSGTQKPMIVLLLQSKLLENRSLRYVFIDDIPIDKKTQKYLAEMCEKLNMWVFVNINGDFEAKNLGNGEILIENGEMFAANADMIRGIEINNVDEKESDEISSEKRTYHQSTNKVDQFFNDEKESDESLDEKESDNSDSETFMLF